MLKNLSGAKMTTGIAHGKSPENPWATFSRGGGFRTAAKSDY